MTTRKILVQVLDIDEKNKIVELRCKLSVGSKKIFIRKFPLSDFAEFDSKKELSVDDQFIITFNVEIKKSEKNLFPEDKITTDVSDLKGSKIFNLPDECDAFSEIPKKSDKQLSKSPIFIKKDKNQKKRR